MPLPCLHSVGLLVHQHTVANALGEAQDRILIKIVIFGKIGAVAFGLRGGLFKQALRIGAHFFIRYRLPLGKPQMAAQMVAGAALLLDQRQLPGRKQAAPKAARNVIFVFAFTLVGAQLRAQCPGSAHHAALPGGCGAANGQIVGAHHLGGQKLGEQRGPAIAEMQAQRLFGVGRAIELQIFLESA